MAEALEKVKQDLGRSAVILHTRTIKRGGLWGMGARTVVEITASNDVRDLPPAERRAIGLGGTGLRGTGSAKESRDNNMTDSRSKDTPPLASSRALGGTVPPFQVYAYRSPQSLRIPPERATPAAGVAIDGQFAGGLATGRMIRSDAGVHENFSAVASGLRDEMNEIRSMVRELLNRPAVAAGRRPADGAALQLPPTTPPEPETPAELQDYYTRLLQNAVADEVAREVIAKAAQRLADCRDRIRARVGGRLDEAVLNQRISDKLKEIVPAVMMETVERMLPPPGPVEVQTGAGQKIVVLVGPTGVGKTTTIAKLAAHFKLRESKRVGLITTDTYRIAAVDQLKAYADIMNLPLEVVFTPDELKQAVGRLNGCDLILVDTSGRSHRDARRLSDLRAFLDAARAIVAQANPAPTGPAKGRKRKRRGAQSAANPLPAGSSVEVHLLLSCTCDQGQLFQVAERFAALGVDRAVFTKLDEAVGLGVVLNVASRLNLRLSYLTTGQDVPDDIEVGHRRRIAERLLKGSSAETEPCPAADAPMVDHLA